MHISIQSETICEEIGQCTFHKIPIFFENNFQQPVYISISVLYLSIMYIIYNIIYHMLIQKKKKKLYKMVRNISEIIIDNLCITVQIGSN